LGHVVLQATGSLLVLVALIIIFADRGGLILTAHSSLGLLVFCCVLIQITVGIISNRIPAVRERAHVVHRWVGRATIIAAVVNIMLGFQAIGAGVALYVVCGVWFLIFAIAFVMPLASDYEEFDMDINLEDEEKLRLKRLTPAAKALFFGYLGVGAVVCAILVALMMAPQPQVIPTVIDTNLDDNALSYSITMRNYSIPGQITNYVCMTLSFSGAPRDAVFFSPIADNVNVLHHIVLFSTPQLDDMNRAVWDCTNMPVGYPVFVWAVGGQDMSLPSDVGLRFGKGFIENAVIQFHYDLSWTPNPAATNEYDSSGVRLTFAPTLQANEMDILIFGIPQGQIQVPPGKPNFQMVNVCPSEGTAGIPHDLQVFAAGLHMHTRGKSIYFDQVRNETSLGYIASLPEWDFNNQQLIYVDRVIKAGDSLITTCIWDTSKDTSVVLGGEDTTREMCYTFLFYYPKVARMRGCMT